VSLQQPQSILERGVQEIGLKLDSTQINQLLIYLQLIQKWNTKFNLVGTSNTNDLLYKHILDSLAIAPYVDRAPVLDVGSGAGLPGIPLAITLPGTPFNLIDKNGKKARFMRQAVIELKLNNVQVTHASVNEFEFRMMPSIVLARAFRQIDDVLEILTKVCAPGGKMMVMLGKCPDEIPLVNGITRCITQKIHVPGLDDSERHLLIATKA
jgi:16S rRNA (guanine527-N7)-methyltransferase